MNIFKTKQTKRFVLPLLSYLLLSIPLLNYAQLSLDWSQNYGGSAVDIPTSVLAMPDGTCLLTGYTNSSSINTTSLVGESDIWLAKISTTGLLEWQKSIGGIGFDKATDLIATADGNIIILAHSNAPNNDIHYGKQDVIVIKLTPDGAAIWTKFIGGIDTDCSRSIVEDNNGDLLIAGYSYSNITTRTRQGHSNAWLMKLNATGDVLWNKYYGGDRHDYFYKIKKANNDFLLIGSSFSDNGNLTDNNGNQDGWLLKINADGVPLWSKHFGTAQQEHFKDAAINNTGEIIAVGTSFSEASSSGDIWIVKTNSQGDLQTNELIGGNELDEANSIIYNADENSYLLAGSTRSTVGNIQIANGRVDALLLKLNANGGKEWAQAYGGFQNDSFQEITAIEGGGFYVLGISDSSFGDLSNNNGAEDFWIAKTEGAVLPLVSLGEDISICAGENIELVASTTCNNCSFLWDDGYDQNNYILSPSVSKIYTVTITNAQGTSNTGSIQVEVLDAPEASIQYSPISCHDASDGSIQLMIESEGAHSVEWNTMSTSTNLDNLSAAIYQVTISNAQSCTLVEQIILDNPPAIAVEYISSPSSCPNGIDGSVEVAIMGGNPPYTYLWSNGSTEQNLSNQSPGIYSLSITDAMDCEQIVDNITIGAPTDLGALITTTEATNNANGSIELVPYGGTPPYMVAWVHGPEGLIIDMLSMGDYTFILTDGNGCTNIQTVTISTTTTRDATDHIIQINPNPSEHFVIISNTETLNIYNLKLYNIHGQLLQNIPFDPMPNHYNLDLTTLAKGTYYLELAGADAFYTKKIIRL